MGGQIQFGVFNATHARSIVEDLTIRQYNALKITAAINSKNPLLALPGVNG